MASLFGAGSGKTRGQTSFSGAPIGPISKNVVDIPGVKGMSDELVRQISEALRTGGIGAGIPIISQAVSGANQATSQAMQGTRDSLASSGLSRTPYGQSILAGQRQSGAQTAAGIPTSYAQNLIGQAPQLSQGLLATILGALRSQTSKGGAYST